MEFGPSRASLHWESQSTPGAMSSHTGGIIDRSSHVTSEGATSAHVPEGLASLAEGGNALLRLGRWRDIA